MSGIVIYTEALKPLTAKRVFEVKLKGVPLCMMYDEFEKNFQMLTKMGVLIQDGNIYTIKYNKSFVVSKSSGGEPVVTKLARAMRFSVKHAN